MVGISELYSTFVDKPLQVNKNQTEDVQLCCFHRNEYTFNFIYGTIRKVRFGCVLTQLFNNNICLKCAILNQIHSRNVRM